MLHYSPGSTGIKYKNIIQKSPIHFYNLSSVQNFASGKKEHS